MPCAVVFEPSGSTCCTEVSIKTKADVENTEWCVHWTLKCSELYLGVASCTQGLKQDVIVHDVSVFQPTAADRCRVLQLLLLRKLCLFPRDIGSVFHSNLVGNEHARGEGRESYRCKQIVRSMIFLVETAGASFRRLQVSVGSKHVRWKMYAGSTFGCDERKRKSREYRNLGAGTVAITTLKDRYRTHTSSLRITAADGAGVGVGLGRTTIPPGGPIPPDPRPTIDGDLCSLAGSAINPTAWSSVPPTLLPRDAGETERLPVTDIPPPIVQVVTGTTPLSGPSVRAGP